ncbi:recombination directionality factor [Microbacterium phage Barnstormer]|uniref:Recombination directionality factor n=1 Tax=Microbacterium phage Barnstormer TaxID=3028491 RepID=A0AAE9ZNF5_9CAUD|nr:recombination directionality factor [Microbacterium phage Barnstormer]WDS52145.1 recombination directionality factor [Microbacterium phage UtzChips]
MAGLKIFGTDPENQPKPRQRFADDIAGRFRSGHQINDRPASLEEWRVTTGDPDVAAKVYELLGGEEPQEWAAKGEDNIEVFTASSSVDIIIENAKALRQRMVLWGRSGKPIYVSDGEYILDDQGHPTDERDPDAELTFAERKAKKEIGATPDIDVFFRLADEPDLGIFQFKTGSWGLARDLAAEDIAGQLEAAEGPMKATLALTPESFVAKNGPMKGKTVSFVKSSLTLKGAA